MQLLIPTAACLPCGAILIVSLRAGYLYAVARLYVHTKIVLLAVFRCAIKILPFLLL